MSKVKPDPFEQIARGAIHMAQREQVSLEEYEAGLRTMREELSIAIQAAQDDLKRKGKS